MATVFLLSPAYCGGRRAAMLLGADPQLAIARKLREGSLTMGEAFERDLGGLAARLSDDARVVLLGSVATGKYVDILAPRLGDRLQFPSSFVGRGDMSRGGLLLRHAASGIELDRLSVSVAAMGTTQSGMEGIDCGILRRPGAQATALVAAMLPRGRLRAAASSRRPGR